MAHAAARGHLEALLAAHAINGDDPLTSLPAPVVAAAEAVRRGLLPAPVASTVPERQFCRSTTSNAGIQAIQVPGAQVLRLTTSNP